MSQPVYWEWLIEHLKHVLTVIMILEFVVLFYPLNGAETKKAHEVKI